MNRIIVPHGTNQKLEKIFRVSHPTIRRALAGTLKTDTAKHISKAAMENGGTEVQIVEKEKPMSLQTN